MADNIHSFEHLHGPGTTFARTGHKIVVIESEADKYARMWNEHLRDYYRYENGFYVPRQLMYVCPRCGNVQYQSVLSTISPDLQCWHGNTIYPMEFKGVY